MVEGWYGMKETKQLKENCSNAVDESSGSVSYRTSRNKSQGVEGSGEPEGKAKANTAQC